MASAAESFEVVVVGAGPGGYPAAIRCAQRGMRTLLVERGNLGGVCLNVGCVPSKAMLHAAGMLRLAGHAADLGITIDTSGASYQQAVAKREAAVTALRKSLTTLLRENGVQVRIAAARLVDPHHLHLEGAEAADEVHFDHLILATGSHPARPPIPGAELPGVVDSDGALRLEAAPARAVIIGGGAVGVEWADIWSAYGSEVSVIEALPMLVPTEEPEIARELARSFTRRGIACHPGARVTGIEPADGGLAVQFTIGDEARSAAADVVLMAVGRRPNTAELGLEAVGIAVEPKGIMTDDFLRTTAPHIFAVGDVNGWSLLAHSATHQGLIAADVIAGHQPAPFDPRVVPGAIFTHPEIASVGMGEAEATAGGLPVRIGRFPFAANARATATGDTMGYVKLVAHEESHVILGASIIGAGAADLIASISLAIHLGARLEDLAHTIQVHPTWSEAVLEAAWAALDEPIHVPRRRPRVSERIQA